MVSASRTSRLAISTFVLFTVAVTAQPLWALDPTDVPKWSQPPGPPMPGTSMGPGENIFSDVDWRAIMTVPPPTAIPNWTIADDFRSDGRPITAVRWWGSYPSEQLEPRPVTKPGGGTMYMPVVEDGFLLSFFSDMPVTVPSTRPPTPGLPFSKPDELLGSYIAPIEAVTITPLPFVGWDKHRIWQYEVCLKDTHLDHQSRLATNMSFNEIKDDIYWLSIVAENGHKIVKTATGDWLGFNTEDPMLPFHYWGWHTSPKEFNDVATMSSLLMPGTQWQYLPQWQPIHPQHGLYDMAFELLTPVPEPGTWALSCAALVGLIAACWRGRSRV